MKLWFQNPHFNRNCLGICCFSFVYVASMASLSAGKGEAPKVLFQASPLKWQRQLRDKFRENFTVIRSHVLRANYGTNPWQEIDQVKV